MHAPSVRAEAELADELHAVRPDLSASYAAGLPGARSAVLTRLWRALAHEPLPWIARREAVRDGLVLHLVDGRRLDGPPVDPYATAAYVGEVRLDGRAYDRPAALVRALGVPHGAAFAVELGHSTASLALSRAAQPSAAPEPVSSQEWEQRLVDGHPYHPSCRSRPGFSVAEQLAYGPEHRAQVRLGLVPVDDALVRGTWPAWLRQDGRVMVPVHPWQSEHVLEVAAEEGPLAHPLMSLRTLALPACGPHVKTALSARLTSSVRDISVSSVEMAAAVSGFMESMAAGTDGLLVVTRTLGAVSAHSPDLAALVRESPETYVNAAAGERVVPVAALPLTGLPASPSWLARFTRLALDVGLRLLERGVALEAHGQNLLVVLSSAGDPLRLVYRDLADIRVSPARLACHGVKAPELSGRIVTDDVTALRRKLFGSLVAGALASTAGSGAALRAALRDAVRDLPSTPDLSALCEGPLPTKALTLMRLSPGRTGDLWTSLPNPLAVSSF
ncbi:IucA/IucC family siderophore biosynthesis protein [Streptomyces sp. RY43-2]|uniref:IucA/IucC family siderophore biosynthesis protein n=1 Tax=Streptomyces macrolidinus TaxID=2952607 RepID=A0ABT0ZM64_9ACTN|nr:IucA/IucC family siderophore biosynthesis protein [Streptomyces macrolidinus]MCN9244679.1 IucA/IucC family siderophore biosynthesis protein [Streptomyces macrolidinus]